MLSHRTLLTKIACCAICCAAAAVATASPPTGTNAGGGLLGRASGMIGATSSKLPTPPAHVEFQRLDLRAPESMYEERAASAATQSAAAFSSIRHTDSVAPTGAGYDLPGGSNVATLRMENKVQEMERRVPREGLPLARLWETKTALLHVGLSPKGKPGLWLMQKVP